MPLPKLSFLRGVDAAAFIGEDDDALSDEEGDGLFLEEEPPLPFTVATLFLAGLLPEFPEFSGRDQADFPEFSPRSCCCSASLLLDLASMTALIAGVSGDGVRLRHLKIKWVANIYSTDFNTWHN